MILRHYIRKYLNEWHEHLDMVMMPNPDVQSEEDFKDEEDLKAKYPKNNTDPMDPYGGSFESRGTRPKPLATSRALSHAKTGFGSGPMSGRYPPVKESIKGVKVEVRYVVKDGPKFGTWVVFDKEKKENVMGTTFKVRSKASAKAKEMNDRNAAMVR